MLLPVARQRLPGGGVEEAAEESGEEVVVSHGIPRKENFFAGAVLRKFLLEISVDYQVIKVFIKSLNNIA